MNSEEFVKFEAFLIDFIIYDQSHFWAGIYVNSVQIIYINKRKTLKKIRKIYQIPQGFWVGLKGPNDTAFRKS